MHAQQLLNKKGTVKTNETHFNLSYLGFPIIWILKLNIAFLYRSNGKVINISSHILRRNFVFFVLRGRRPTNGVKFSINHRLAFEMSIRSYIDISKAIERN